MRVRRAVFAAMLAFVCAAHASAAVESRVETVGDGRMLVHEAVVPATPQVVWAFLATADGWKSWAVPAAWMDFRHGGMIETSYDPAAKPGDKNNIRSRILAYVPGRMLAIQAERGPEGFPFAEQLPSVFNVFELTPDGDRRTRVRLTGVGYGRGEAFDKMLKFFEAGNRWSLEKLIERAENGPIDWTKVPKPK